MADHIVSAGYKDVGYEYVSIDVSKVIHCDVLVLCHSFIPFKWHKVLKVPLSMGQYFSKIRH